MHVLLLGRRLPMKPAGIAAMVRDAFARRDAAGADARHVYAMHMLKERLQVLVSRDQRRRLESEAQRRGMSVGGLIREAVDAHLGHVGEAERLEALDGIRAASGRFLSPEELNRLVDEERDAVVGAAPGSRSR